MIRISFNIGWIWGSGSSAKDLFFREWQISKNKSLELQITRFNHKFDLLGLDIGGYPRSDHSPYHFNLTLLNVEFLCQIYDHRHWDFEKCAFEVYKK